jgi:hypothetical protein
MSKKILALVSEPVSGETLKKAVGPERAETAEVLVVAPALNTRRHFLLSDVDAAIGRAEEVQEETVERMEEEGGTQNWLEEGLVDEARKRFDRPVEHLVVER